MVENGKPTREAFRLACLGILHRFRDLLLELHCPQHLTGQTKPLSLAHPLHKNAARCRISNPGGCGFQPRSLLPLPARPAGAPHFVLLTSSFVLPFVLGHPAHFSLVTCHYSLAPQARFPLPPAAPSARRSLATRTPADQRFHMNFAKPNNLTRRCRERREGVDNKGTCRFKD